MAFIGYIRQSREKEGGLSPETQRADIEHWASAPGKDRKIKFLKPDLDWSGKSLDRPSMQEALRLVRSGAAEGIIVSKLDRLTRSIGDLSALIKEAQEGGWTIIALDLGVDLLTTNGKMFAGVVGILSEWYLDRVTEEWAKTRKHKITVQGAHWGAPPLGYLRGRTTNARGHVVSGALVVDEQWAPVVQEVFARKVAGASWADLARLLTDAGAPSFREKAASAREGRPVRGSVWAPSAVQALVANRAYLGEASAGKLLREDAHPKLVEADVWRRANRKGANKPGERRGGPLLGGGMLRCGTCGSGMVMTKTNTGYRFYRCRAATCTDRVAISATKIEPYLIEQAFERVQWVSSPMEATDTTAFKTRLAELEVEAVEVEEGEEDGSISRIEAAKLRTTIEAERVAVEEAIDAAAAEGDAGTDEWTLIPVEDIRRSLFEEVENWGDSFESLAEAIGSGDVPVKVVPRDVTKVRAFLRHVLGQVRVLPAGGKKTIPVEERIEVEFLTPAAGAQEPVVAEEVAA